MKYGYTGTITDTHYLQVSYGPTVAYIKHWLVVGTDSFDVMIQYAARDISNKPLEHVAGMLCIAIAWL